MPDTPFQPSWAKYEKDANNQTDAKKALEASDAFEAERAKEMRTSKKARDWENSRKKSIAKQKPAWVKQERLKEATAVLNELSKFKRGGVFDYDITPMPGYILVKVEQLQQQVGEIMLPDAEEPNTGIVIKVSDDIITQIGDSTGIAKCPVKPGDKIMFKVYAGAGIAGLAIRSKDEDYRLMRWGYNPQESDLLGILT